MLLAHCIGDLMPEKTHRASVTRQRHAYMMERLQEERIGCKMCSGEAERGHEPIGALADADAGFEPPTHIRRNCLGRGPRAASTPAPCPVSWAITSSRGTCGRRRDWRRRPGGAPGRPPQPPPRRHLAGRAPQTNRPSGCSSAGTPRPTSQACSRTCHQQPSHRAPRWPSRRAGAGVSAAAAPAAVPRRALGQFMVGSWRPLFRRRSAAASSVGSGSSGGQERSWARNGTLLAMTEFRVLFQREAYLHT